ncbi:uncharacterized protein LOC107001235 [Solanum pennellii]|uniref:Uncharacterized protein LOC107001235 n=1 Tax=Solanum pennellii TaxID=28526 RepID=A0ABM1FCE5_SOLPN|nr:uncharacterized protein LOC107001235 [Solanum pennellii]
MPPRKAFRGRLRRNVEELEVPNAPEVQPQREVTNVEFWEAIRMLSQVMTYHVVQKRASQQEEVDTSRVREFLRVNPPSITRSSPTEDPENFVEELKKVFEVMHMVDVERVELAAYQLMGVARTWFDQCKDVEEEKVKNREEYRKKKVKTGNEFAQQKGGSSRPQFHKPKGNAPSSPSAPTSRNQRITGPSVVKASRFFSSVVKRGAPMGDTSSTCGGTNRLYALNNLHEQENSADVVTGVIRVFDFTAYELLDPGASLSFVTAYVAMNFEISL